MPGWTLPTPQLYAVFVSRQGMVPAVRAFVDYLVEVLDEGKLEAIPCPEGRQADIMRRHASPAVAPEPIASRPSARAQSDSTT
jgi:hypothetical protein